MEAVKAVQKAIDYMEDHLYEHVELEQIAAMAYLSVPSMYRIFYALTGHPLKEYIRKRRTSQAAILLRQTKLAVVDIAVACGFESYQAFTKSFKKLVGLTPGTYRHAVLYYSFERINLLEKVSYAERREVSEQYPDVKVIRVAPMNVLSFRYRSPIREGLEDQAFYAFYKRLAESEFPLAEARIIGRNAEPAGAGSQDGYEYELMAAYSQQQPPLPDDLDYKAAVWPGGLYAVSLAPADDASAIIASWNRLLAEWLPKSTFTLGEHSFIEEWMHYKGRVTRLKLFLPVERAKEQPSIEVMELASVPIRLFRSYGVHSQTLADEQLTAWLTEQEISFEDEQPIQLFMFANYGILPSSDEYWYALGVSLPKACSSLLGDEKTIVEGGLYACLTTPAYGAMTGVMDKLYSWLYHNDNYAHDEGRQGYAKYIPGSPDDLERTTSVTTCIPVRLTH